MVGEKMIVIVTSLDTEVAEDIHNASSVYN